MKGYADGCRRVCFERIRLNVFPPISGLTKEYSKMTGVSRDMGGCACKSASA